MGSRSRREKDYKYGRSDRRNKGMVLFSGFCSGSYLACLHSKRTRSSHSLCKLNVGAIIENSIMKYHEGNKRGLIPHPTTITRLYIRAGEKGSWAKEEECPKVSPLTLTGVSKRPRNQKKKGVIVEADSRDEEENARQEEDTLLVEDQEEQDPKT